MIDSAVVVINWMRAVPMFAAAILTMSVVMSDARTLTPRLVARLVLAWMWWWAAWQ